MSFGNLFLFVLNNLKRNFSTRLKIINTRKEVLTHDPVKRFARVGLINAADFKFSAIELIPKGNLSWLIF